MFPSKKGTVTFMKSQTIKTLGGVMSAEDVIELMLAGATAVEVGAANLVDPFACRRIVEDLPRVMQKYNINDLNDIIGGAHHG